MQIVELGDCSMVIMKDSEDPPWISVGDIYRHANDNYKRILIDKGDQLTFHYLLFLLKKIYHFTIWLSPHA